METEHVAKMELIQLEKEAAIAKARYYNSLIRNNIPPCRPQMQTYYRPQGNVDNTENIPSQGPSFLHYRDDYGLMDTQLSNL